MFTIKNKALYKTAGIFCTILFVTLAHFLFLEKKIFLVDTQQEDSKGKFDSMMDEAKDILDFIDEAEADENYDGLNQSQEMETFTDFVSGAARAIPVNKPQRKIASGYIAPGIVATRPLTYKRDNLGRMVCEKRNDKPGISTQGKPIHIDMECCLDYDEIPNPYCYYYQKNHLKIFDDYQRKKEKFLRRYWDERGL